MSQLKIGIQNHNRKRLETMMVQFISWYYAVAFLSSFWCISLTEESTSIKNKLKPEITFFDNKRRFEVGELFNQKMLLLYSMYYWSNQPTRRRQMRMKNTISGLDVVSRLSFRATVIYFQESYLENWLVQQFKMEEIATFLNDKVVREFQYFVSTADLI